MSATGLTRFTNFWKKPWKQKKQSFAFRYLRLFPGAFVPTRLPNGDWWFAENDFLGSALLWNGFENEEFALMERMISPGMTVLDIGAHKGFYTLLFSSKTGTHGRVLAFEPSKRERFRLHLHLKVNSCRNVQVFDFALGEKEGEATLFVVDGAETGMNSLQPVANNHSVHEETVAVRSLDTLLVDLHVERVDFVKMDVEGGELGVLRGASTLLDRSPRPYIFSEISDLRTKSWGYQASEILRFMENKRFQWFSPRPDGLLSPLGPLLSFYDGNFMGVPEERMPEIQSRIAKEPFKSSLD